MGAGGLFEREILCCAGKLDRAGPVGVVPCGEFDCTGGHVSRLISDEFDDLLDIECESTEFQDTELLVDANEYRCGRNAIRSESNTCPALRDVTFSMM